MEQSMLEAKDNFVDLERLRSQLEENVSKLRKSLQHWQIWEAEYEGLKEEIQGLDDQHNRSELVRAANESVGTLLNEKEIKLLLIDDKGRHRGGSQILGLLSRRIEYVQQNVKTMVSLLRTAEEKLATSTVINRPGVHNEEGLPLTEIREELDAEGNIISSSVSAPSNAAPQVVEALRMAGVGGLPDKPDVIPKSDVDSTDRKDQGQVTEAYDPQATSILKPSKDSSNKSKEPATSSRRKNVTFAQGTKLINATNSKPKSSNNRRSLRNINEIKRRAALTSFPETSVKPNGLSDNNEKKSIGLGIASRTVSAEPYQSISEPFRNPGDDSANYHHKDNTVPSSELEIASETINHFSGFTSGQKKVPIKIEPNDDTVDQDPELGSPILPADESPEDAALRREMLEYSMNLVGNIVAEIDLDEDDDDTSERSYSDGEDGPNSDASSAEEDEDEYGRTKRRVLDDVYLEEMRALERKLNAEIQNIGPQGDIVACTSELVDSRISIDDLLKAESDLHMDRPESKGVRFASEPDVQDSPPTDENNDNIRLVSRPVKDAVIERVKPADVITEPQPETKKKVSRFKRTRNQGPINTEPGQQPGAISNKNTTQHSAATPTPPLNLTATTTENRTITSPSGPPDRTHNPTIIERPYSATTSPHVSLEPDEFDPALIHQQVATEYHRMRNRQIQRQGGFLATDEEKAEVPLTEQEGGGPRVSRFKAARLARLG